MGAMQGRSSNKSDTGAGQRAPARGEHGSDFHTLAPPDLKEQSLRQTALNIRSGLAG